MYLFFETFFTESTKDTFKKVSYILFYLIISMEYILLDIPILTLSLNIFGLLGLAFLYPSNYKKRILGA